MWIIASCDQYNNPNGYGGWGGNCPLQELVDAYEVVKDGVASKFDWNNPEEKKYSRNMGKDIGIELVYLHK